MPPQIETESEFLLSARQLTYAFTPGRPFLGPLDVCFARGEVHAVVGPNGAGKSTLLRLLVGLQSPSSGEVDLKGRRLSTIAANQRARSIAFLPQQPIAPPSTTVEEIVRMGRHPYRGLRVFESATDLSIVVETMRLTDVVNLRDRQMGTLSGGELQRVHLAAALAQQPEVLALDEPTSGLDLRHQLRLFKLLCELSHTRGLSTIVVTHDLNLALQFCDSASVLCAGRLVVSGAPQTVLTAEYLESVYGVRFKRVSAGELQIPWLIAREVTESSAGEAVLSMAPLSVRRFWGQLAGYLALLLLLVVIGPGIGPQDVGIADAWRVLLEDDPDPVQYGIAWRLRFPRTLKALVAGVTLSLCGAVFQTLFRNPLATPYTVGISSGASLGALIAYKLNLVSPILGLSSVSLCAFGGAVAVLLVVLFLARSSARVSGNTLLLAGVTIGLFCSGAMMFLTSLADVTETHRTVRWLMGSLDTFGSVEIKTLLPLVVPVWLILILQAHRLNQFEIGPEIAATRGVDTARLEVVGILAGSLGVAAVVSMCGPIGFVGLIIPHLTRLVTGRDHRILLPAAALLGGAFLIGCDFLTTLAPGWYGAVVGRETTAARLPIGVMTAVIGTPVFLSMLCARKLAE